MRIRVCAGNDDVFWCSDCFSFQFYANEMGRHGGRGEGWGSAEATEMVLNNVFYITAKVSVNM